MECPQCKRDVEAQWRLCPFCATALENQICPSCGEKMQVEWQVCPMCGKSRVSSPSQAGLPRPMASGEREVLHPFVQSGATGSAGETVELAHDELRKRIQEDAAKRVRSTAQIPADLDSLPKSSPAWKTAAELGWPEGQWLYG